MRWSVVQSGGVCADNRGMRPQPLKRNDGTVMIARGMRIGPVRSGVSAARDPYKLERRGEVREAHEGRLIASYTDGATRSGITHLELVDRSAGGMGARSRVRIEPGMIVTICPEGSTVPWVSARAARCEREEGGWWRVGLEMAGMRAA